MIILATELSKALADNWVLAVVFSLILIMVGVLIGYIVGNTSLRSKVTNNIDNLERDKIIQQSVLDSVGLGIVVYDEHEAIYANETMFALPHFLKDGLPNSLEGFLETFDKDNQLKSNYILSCENGINVIRVNYCEDRYIYEIKIIKKKADETDKYFPGTEFAIVIVDDITEIKDDERRQKDLAANVSHELKTPLTSINTSVFSIFKSSEDGNMPTNEDLRLWAQRIQVNSVRMQDIVNDFLVLSQCSHTNVMSIFDLYEVTSNAIANVSEYPGRANVKIIMPEEGAYPLVYGNSKLIMRSIINLLTNAIKYIDFDGKTEEHTIHVSVVTIDDRIGVQVEDNGRGIPAKDIEHLFERFYRVDNSGSREVGGTGIGLAIAKEIADMHDGSISVTSTLNAGSTFTLSLPTGKTVFDGVYADSKAGIISEKPNYRAAAYFLGLQECEASRSMGYDDLAGLITEYEGKSETDVIGRDKALIALLKAYGNERFADLEEELLYVEDFDEGEDSVTGLDEEPQLTQEQTANIAQDMGVMKAITSVDSYDVMEEATGAYIANAEVEAAKLEQEERSRLVTDSKTIEEDKARKLAEEEAYQAQLRAQEEELLRQQEEQDMEEAKRLAKEEARKILTQPVVQRSVNAAEQPKNAAQIARENKEKAIIHPTSSAKRYNKTDKAEGEEPVKSSLKQVLDDSKPVRPE
ncbi:MAG: hypothetical protein K5745_06870 [Saccharofermentans sp.]|nr:hypothetical protein [Saccharofermentans sp.]